MTKHTGGCYCGKVRYEIVLYSDDDARTSLCHCKNCKRFTGGPFGVTIKIPLSSWKVIAGSPKHHTSDNGSSMLHREFCEDCGSPILEYGEAAARDWRYVFHGTLDDTNVLPPKGEFFCKYRCHWMPEIEGIFHKRELHD
ncbi:uncharacterized protein FOMMEDRAFT_130880 [Fomitiporia mediterranea MF3/22]|uniref:uncharacterized protein n=1 Tax=Fomitiporia mediterranea (strain MF3/22) TaxID=694068 RepID=UPI000440877F|nr:uncharacterized protein FOMMEDRAFT_130880 [Fomitiporia mediterranea MF3/22]EJD07793.1 hypothetical protein FOMMEDRAFT_130880 [Fomitiporia mediterranea MF3/22]